MVTTLYTDGGGDGWICTLIELTPTQKWAIFLHSDQDKTHNESEWHALYTAMTTCMLFQMKEAIIYSDSKLTVDQFNGDAVMNTKEDGGNPVFKTWYDLCKKIEEEFFTSLAVQHIYRKRNKAGVLLEKKVHKM